MSRFSRARGACVGQVTVFAVGISAVACTADDGSRGADEHERASIVGGTLSGPEDDGIVFVATPTTACTGALIAPNLVLTAANCVSEFDPTQSFVCGGDGSVISGDASFGAFDEAQSIAIHVGTELAMEPVARGKKVWGTGAQNLCENDLALVLLDQDIDAPIVSLRLGRRTERGELGRVIGYGLTSLDPGEREDGRHVREGMVVTAVANDETDATAQLASGWLVTGGGPCSGDSGAPFFASDSNAAVGVLSRLSTSACEGPGVKAFYSLLAPFEALIRDALTEAGHEPVLEPAPSGEAGGGGEGGGPLAEGGGSAEGATGDGVGGAGGSAGPASGGAPAGGVGSAGRAAVNGTAGLPTGGEGSAPRSSTPLASYSACKCRSVGSERGPGSLVGWLLAAIVLRGRRRLGRG